MARPMPRLAPVTRAIFAFRFMCHSSHSENHPIPRKNFTRKTIFRTGESFSVAFRSAKVSRRFADKRDYVTVIDSPPFTHCLSSPACRITSTYGSQGRRRSTCAVASSRLQPWIQCR